MNKTSKSNFPLMKINNPALDYIFKRTAGKPISYLLHSYDVGQSTDYSADFVWHLLKKEKGFNIRDRGKLGLINFDSGISLFSGLRVDRGDWLWGITSGTEIHLISLLVEKFSLKELDCRIYFIPFDSATLLIALHVKNCGQVSRNLGIACVISKETGLDLKPQQNFKPTFTSTGRLLREEYDEKYNTVFICHEEWDKREVRGKLLAGLGSSATGSHFLTSRTENPSGVELPFRYAGLEKEISIKPDEEKEIKFALHMRRFASKQAPNPWGVPLFSIEGIEAAKGAAVKRNKKALLFDRNKFVKESVERYRTMPVVELPEENWVSDFYASLELARGNTFSPYKAMKRPFTNFCRVYSHNPYDWWHEGEGGTFARTTFGTVIYAPELVKDHIRNVLDCQDESGRLPFCVNQNGVHDITSERSDMEKISDSHDIWRAFTGTPEVVWQIWNVYLWTGDRDFLKYGYESGRRNHEWWLKNRDKDGDGLCCWEGVIETMRDNMPPIPTWREIELRRHEALDLNCYLLFQEKCLAEMADELGNGQEAVRYREMAQCRAGLMNKHMWDEKDKCYYGIDELDKDKKARVRDISTFLPLWAGLAPPDRARRLIDLYKNEREFKTGFPVPTLAMSSTEFNPGEGWYGATWTWFNWLVILGLKEYGYYRMSAELGYKTTDMEFKSLGSTGHFREYYNSQTGEGIGLYDYEWSILPAAIIVYVLFGVQPKADGLEILPSLPDKWMKLTMGNLHIRKSKVNLEVERSEKIDLAEVKINGKMYPVFNRRGVKIPWNEVCNGLDIKIIQPVNITEDAKTT